MRSSAQQETHHVNFILVESKSRRQTKLQDGHSRIIIIPCILCTRMRSNFVVVSGCNTNGDLECIIRRRFVNVVRDTNLKFIRDYSIDTPQNTGMLLRHKTKLLGNPPRYRRTSEHSTPDWNVNLSVILKSNQKLALKFHLSF